MRVLLLTEAFNSLTQRLHVELTGRGHLVSVELDINDAVTAEAVDLFRPHAVVAPFLKRAIPESVWRRVPCLIVHPGIPGDRGPSALDWAIEEGRDRWGVTVLQAEADMDAGPVWAYRMFDMRDARKSSLYRFEVTEAASGAVNEALDRLAAGDEPVPAERLPDAEPGRWRDAMRQADRAIDWRRNDTATVLRRIRAADGQPGVADELAGVPCRLFDAHPEDALTGPPGELIARREGAVCRATIDGAVWIGHLRATDGHAPPFKLPATQVLGERAAALAEDPLDPMSQPPRRTWQDMRYVEHGPVGVLHFDLYNGAMSTRQCERLLAAYRDACARPTSVLVLAGGADFWSNGLHLNVIEAAASPADESWRNINAMDDLAEAIIRSTDRLTVAALGGNAAAGGAFLALAADRVVARAGVVLNPHYKNMGNLYGSELWTYLLPRRAGAEGEQRVMGRRLPLGPEEAADLGLVDEVGPNDRAAFDDRVLARARELADDPELTAGLAAKADRLAADEADRPLTAYRDAELEHMRLNFYGFDPSYHVARYRFVHRSPNGWTPRHLALHRQLGWRVPDLDEAAG